MENFLPVNRCINFNGKIQEICGCDLRLFRNNHNYFRCLMNNRHHTENNSNNQNYPLQALMKKRSHHPCYNRIVEKYKDTNNHLAVNDSSKQICIDNNHEIFEWTEPNYLSGVSRSDKCHQKKNIQEDMFPCDRNNSNCGNRADIMAQKVGLNNSHLAGSQEDIQYIEEGLLSSNKTKTNDSITPRSFTDSFTVSSHETKNSHQYEQSKIDTSNVDDKDEDQVQKVSSNYAVQFDELSESENIETLTEVKQNENLKSNLLTESQEVKSSCCHSCYRNIRISGALLPNTKETVPMGTPQEFMLNRLRLNLPLLKYKKMRDNSSHWSSLQDDCNFGDRNDISAFEYRLASSSLKDKRSRTSTQNDHEPKSVFTYEKKGFYENILCDACNKVIRDSVRDILDKKLVALLNKSWTLKYLKEGRNNSRVSTSMEHFNHDLRLESINVDNIRPQNFPGIIVKSSNIEIPSTITLTEETNSSLQEISSEMKKTNEETNPDVLHKSDSKLNERSLIQSISQAIISNIMKSSIQKVTNEIFLMHLVESCETVLKNSISKQLVNNNVEQCLHESRAMDLAKSLEYEGNTSKEQKENKIDRNVIEKHARLNFYSSEKRTIPELSKLSAVKHLTNCCSMIISESVVSDLLKGKIKHWSRNYAKLLKKKKTCTKRCGRKVELQRLKSVENDCVHSENKSIQVPGQEPKHSNLSTHSTDNLQISSIRDNILDSHISEIILKIIKSKLESLSPDHDYPSKQMSIIVSSLSRNIYQLIDGLLKKNIHKEDIANSLNTREFRPNSSASVSSEQNLESQIIPENTCSDDISNVDCLLEFHTNDFTDRKKRRIQFRNEKIDICESDLPIKCSSKEHRISSPVIKSDQSNYEDLDRVTMDKLFDVPANYVKPYTSNSVLAFQTPSVRHNRNKVICKRKGAHSRLSSRSTSRSLLEYTQNLLHGLLRFHTNLSNYLSGKSKSRGLLSPLAECVGKYFRPMYRKYITVLQTSDEYDSFKSLFKWRVEEIYRTIIFYETCMDRYHSQSLPEHLKRQLFINDKVIEILDTCLQVIVAAKDFTIVAEMIYDLKTMFES